VGLLSRQRSTFTVYDAKRASRRLERIRKDALTAAAAPSRQTGEGGVTWLNQAWQSLAFGYYVKMGECWNPAQFYARSMSKIDVLVGEVQDDGEIIPCTDTSVTSLFEPIRQYGRGEGGLQASYGRLKFLIGEGRLCQSRPPLKVEPNSASMPPVWEYLSPTELGERDEGRTIVRKTSAQGSQIEYENIGILEDAGDPEPGQMRMWRFWRRHPQYSMEADSPVRAVLDLYEQLWWVTMGERADIQNRIANAGILLVPTEINMTPTEAELAAMAENPDLDVFTLRIGDMLMAAIGDPQSAAAATPGMIRAPADLLHPDKFRHIRFHDPMTSLFSSQREEALIKRIGLGLDMPIDELTGEARNHWGIWHLDDEKWAHVEPVAQAWCDDVGSAVWAPLLQANGVKNPEKYPIIFDNTDLVTDPDKGKTAIVLHKDGVLSADATLEANGFDTDDAMTGAEKEEWLAIQLRSAEMLGVEPAPAEGIADEEEPDTEDEAEEDAGEEEEPPALAADGTLRGIAEFAVTRAREMAGAKVRALKRSCEDCFAGLEDVPNTDIIAALGRERMERIGAPAPGQLVAGMVISYMTTCERLGLHVTEEQAMKVAGYAATTVFNPQPPPIPDDVLA